MLEVPLTRRYSYLTPPGPEGSKGTWALTGA